MNHLIEITTASWSTWALVSARFFGAMLILPFFSEQSIPLRFRWGFAFLLALVVAPLDLSGNDAVVAFSDPLSAMISLGGELALGWILGATIAVVIWGARLGAAWLGAFTADSAFATGEQNQSEESALTTIMTLLAALVFLALEGHRLVMLMLMDSFQKIPAGIFSSVLSGTEAQSSNVKTDGIAGFVEMAGQQTWVIGLEIALPAIFALLLITLVLGVLSRVVPEIDVFFTGFALRTCAGFALIFVSLPFISEIFAFVVTQSLNQSSAVLGILAGG